MIATAATTAVKVAIAAMVPKLVEGSDISDDNEGDASAEEDEEDEDDVAVHNPSVEGRGPPIKDSQGILHFSIQKSHKKYTESSVAH